MISYQYNDDGLIIGVLCSSAGVPDAENVIVSDKDILLKIYDKDTKEVFDFKKDAQGLALMNAGKPVKDKAIAVSVETKSEFLTRINEAEL